MRETRARFLACEDPLEKEMATQYSCLENPMEGGAWWAIVHGVAKSRTGLSDFTSLHFIFLTCGVSWTLPGFFACCYPVLFLKALSWSNHWTLVHFLPFRDHCPSLPHAHSLKNCSYVCSLRQVERNFFLCYSVLSRCLVFDILILYLIFM